MTPAALDPVTATPAPTQAALIAAWWQDLPTARRRQLLSADAGTPLPHSVSTELARCGVASPLVLVAEHGRLVRRAVPSPALLDLLARERGAGSGGGDQPRS